MTDTTDAVLPSEPVAVPVQFAAPQFAGEWEAALTAAREQEIEDEVSRSVERTPCFLLDEDGEPHEVRQFYMVEDETGEGTWILRRRTSEAGFGSPLLWADRNQVATQLRIEAIASGCYGESRVITVQVTHRDAPEILCVYCKEWGHREDDCETLEVDGKGIEIRRTAARGAVSDMEIDLARSAQGIVGGPPNA